MKKSRTLPVAVLFLLGAITTAFSSAARREISAITVHPEGPSKIQLRSTDRLPDAAGSARVERRGGMTEIEVQLDSLRPAALFGGDYNTYVLWIVPPQGPAENVGEFQLDGDRTSLQTSTEATTFAMLVTAEPHYLVTAPSPFVILQNAAQTGTIPVRYEPMEGVYNFERSTLVDVKTAKGRVHTEVRQAYTAVRLAQRADASRLAPEALEDSQRSLDRTLDLWRRRVDRSEIAAQARTTVRLALAAQHLAEDRAFQARLETEGSGGGKGEPERRVPRDH